MQTANVKNLFLATFSVGLALSALGCGSGVTVGAKIPGSNVDVGVAVPAAAPPPVAVVAPPPPAHVTTGRKIVLQGLPLQGAQLDIVGTIEFETNSARLTDSKSSLVVLNMLATAGRAYPAITRLRVEGHTDSDGDEGRNQMLSEQRAIAVVQWLSERGIDPRRLHPVGCGSRDPLVPNSSMENKQRNRRTEFDIEEIDGQIPEGATTPCAPNSFRRAY